MRHFLTVLHGWGAGGIFLVGFPLALIAIAGTTASATHPPSHTEESFVKRALWALATVGWVAVSAGTYVIYPWYRAKPPAGTADLAGYPRSLLLSQADTSWLHSFGMEWKEHVAWLAPILLTVVAYIYTIYGASLARHRGIRATALAFTVIAFFASGVAGEFGKLLGDHAPVQRPVAAQAQAQAQAGTVK
jgi:hypothetical protein